MKLVNISSALKLIVKDTTWFIFIFQISRYTATVSTCENDRYTAAPLKLCIHWEDSKGINGQAPSWTSASSTGGRQSWSFQALLLYPTHESLSRFQHFQRERSLQNTCKITLWAARGIKAPFDWCSSSSSVCLIVKQRLCSLCLLKADPLIPFKFVYFI